MAAGIDGARSAPELRPHCRGPGGALEGAARPRRGEPGAPPDLRGRRAHDLRAASPHRDRRPSLLRGVSGHAHGRADGRSRPHPHRNRPRGQRALVVGRRRGPPGPVRSSRHHLPTGDRRTRSGGGAQAGRAGHLRRRPRAGGAVGARQGDRGDASRTRGPLLFAATVGEEGEGDLRGVRYLFREGGPARNASAFLALDGAGLSRVVTNGLGSRRFRLSARGPGGHSWVDWGTPNPIHALGRAVVRFTELGLAKRPRTTLSVGRHQRECHSAGSVGRARSAQRVARRARPSRRQHTSVRRCGHRRRQRPWPAAACGPGDRGAPGGQDRSGERLVQSALAATRAVEATPELAVSSTDSNIPMALGIPAVTIGAGGEAGLAHTLDEWCHNEGGPEGVLRALLTVLFTVVGE